VAYGKSSGHVTDVQSHLTSSVTGPWKVKVMTPIRLGPV